MEFDHTHPDKTDFGNAGVGSGMFAYLANDLLQMHIPGGKQTGFVPDRDTFLKDITPEEYCVGRYIDRGLEDHTPYYYRVCAVNKDDKAGPFSREFRGITKEIPEVTL